MKHVLEFETPVASIEQKVAELKKLADESGADFDDEISQLEKKARDLRKGIFADLDPWQRVQLARHPERPYTLDYIPRIIDNWVEVHGDRFFRDDQAIITGYGVFRGVSVAVIGHQKGHSTKANLKHNFGSPHPEGFRKALRVMHTAERFGMPIICFLDTAGAYPGIGAEERGQAEAIAKNILEMHTLTVPVIVAVIGEGGSGGALGIGIGNRVLIQEYAYYSVISPEGCAAILWRDRVMAPQAVAALRVTADELYRLKVVDEIIAEPEFGAHRNYDEAARFLADALEKHLKELSKMTSDQLITDRREKYYAMGEFMENGTVKGGRWGTKGVPLKKYEKNSEL
ncbi:MAG: acetyl-CoA carboxylase carboxyltransferase subunit alpha [bacterium]|nr:acetyl-CoA carboxylase carboxyltransferase subunit alpha [bacterium]